MTDENTTSIKAPAYVKIATLQLTTQSEVLDADHARRLFNQLKEKGYGMRLELWSATFNRKLDQYPQ